MILSQFYIYSRGDTIHINFEHGYKCHDFMESVVTSWKCDSIANSVVFIIRDYEFEVTVKDDGIVSVSVHSEEGFATVIQSRAFLFRVDNKCISVCCGNEVHRYYYV